MFAGLCSPSPSSAVFPGSGFFSSRFSPAEEKEQVFPEILARKDLEITLIGLAQTPNYHSQQALQTRLGYIPNLTGGDGGKGVHPTHTGWTRSLGRGSHHPKQAGGWRMEVTQAKMREFYNIKQYFMDPKSCKAIHAERRVPRSN